MLRVLIEMLVPFNFEPNLLQCMNNDVFRSLLKMLVHASFSSLQPMVVTSRKEGEDNFFLVRKS